MPTGYAILMLGVRMFACVVPTVRTMLRETAAAPAAASPASETAPVQPGIVTFADVVVDLRAHTVHRTGVAVALSPGGYALLATLVTRRGEVITRGTSASRASCGSRRSRRARWSPGATLGRSRATSSA